MINCKLCNLPFGLFLSNLVAVKGKWNGRGVFSKSVSGVEEDGFSLVSAALVEWLKFKNYFLTTIDIWTFIIIRFRI